MKSTADRDPAADFGRYRTFAFLDDHPIGNPEVHEAFKQVIEVELTGKGLERDDANPDLWVSVYGKTDANMRLDVWTYGYSGWWGGYAATIAPRDIDVGTVVLDVVEVERKRLVYRAIASDSLPDRPRGDGRIVFEAVDALLAEYPSKP